MLPLDCLGVGGSPGDPEGALGFVGPTNAANTNRCNEIALFFEPGVETGRSRGVVGLMVSSLLS